MKSMHIDAVENFPFPTPPDRNMLRNAQMVLTHLGALQAPNEGVSKGGVDAVAEHSVTELGKAMSLFPVSPRYAKMLVASQQQGCLPYVVAIVAALSVGDPFLREHGLNAKGEEEEEEEIDDNVRSERGMSDKRRAFFQSQQVRDRLRRVSVD